jgi:uncharacterized membrane protein
MKEVKSFFTEDNRLNKGYASSVTSSREGYRKNMSDALPPPDVLAVYEEMHPGTFEKLLHALEKEQKHRHTMEQINIEMQARAQKMGRVFGLFIICVIGYVVLELAKQGMLIGGLIFAALAFAGIFSVSVFAHSTNSKKSYDKRHYKDKNDRTSATTKTHMEETQGRHTRRQNNGRSNRRG